MALPAAAIESRAPERDHDQSAIILKNSQFELSLANGQGLTCRLTHLATGAKLAEGQYSYSFGSPVFTDPDRDNTSVTFHGIVETGMKVRHRFTVSQAAPWIEEEIEVSNPTSVPFDLHVVRLGFVLPLEINSGVVQGPWADHVFTAIPFRREPAGSVGENIDIKLQQILTGQFSSQLFSAETQVTPDFASEAWAWTDGKNGFLITKYSPGGLEFAVLDRVALPAGKVALRWGGAGIHHGKPQHGAWLNPGETHKFGVTRITPFAGDWQQGFYTFRAEMEERSHGCPSNFNPPVHWNELYDNKLWWLPGDEQDDPEMRKKYYTLESIKEEASKARDIGCEALYMDPGWDITFGSMLWDENRLGSYKSFVSMLSSEFGLRSSLHTPLSGWCDSSSFPIEANRVDWFGKRRMWDKSAGFIASPLCGSSRQYIDTAAGRLKALAKDGAAFFMFDGTVYHEECWDSNHGHPVPARLEEHEQARCRLARMVHAEYPHVLIEMHNPSPIYYGHGSCPEGQEVCNAQGFDVVWAFELMWRPMDDLITGHSIALYYYNLAYSLPLYIHIDLRTDNRNALVFWWNASTCRHLGIGGTHSDPEVRKAQKDAMAAYRRLKPLFASGIFFGVDEQTHVHAAPDRQSAVINCFNLDDKDIDREIHFDPARVGLAASKEFKFSTDGPFRRSAGLYMGTVHIPARGHLLIEVS
jgi:hypothetical protein